MVPEKNSKSKRIKEHLQAKTDELLDKLEDKIDETTDKMYQSETYKKASQTTEKATLSLFRKAGRWWGKL